MAAPKPDKKTDDFGLDWDADDIKIDWEDDGLDLGLFKDNIKVDIDNGLDFKIDDGLEGFKIDIDPKKEIELLKNMDLGLDSDPFKLPDIE